MITYRDLDGNTMTLRAFSGQYIRYALPDSWLGGGGAQGLTPNELVALINQTDQLYGTFRDTIGGEPRGDGLMTIAIVPLTTSEGGAVGTALLGIKTCEIGASQLIETKQALSEGRLPDTLLHEVAHNFDIYRNYLGYYPDSFHSWTDFWIVYSQYLMRSGIYNSMPDDTLGSKIYDFTSRWNALATSGSWERCVKSGGGCESEGVFANKAIAGLLLRYARLHGQAALRRIFDFYKIYKATHDPNEVFSFTPEQKNDLLAEALSYGINLKMSGEIDSWYWPLSADECSRLQTLYPAPNPNVLDTDHDGWTPAQGDFDDTNPNVHPGAPELINGRDDDCNGFIDDVQRTASPNLFSPPARLVGHVRSNQSETFRFEAAGPVIIRARIMSGNWMGQVSVIPDGQITAIHQLTLEQYKSNDQVWALPNSGPWVLRVDWLSGGEGNYEVVLTYPPVQSAGDIFALPLRPLTSTQAHVLVPGSLARALVTLPGLNAAQADAEPDSRGNWPTVLSGMEVRVDALPSAIIAVRPTGNSCTIDFVVPSQTSTTAGARVPILVRHLPTGVQWASAAVELRDSVPALWS
jgi:hypothetical protein